MQEALPGQMDDLAEAFPDFSFEGVGRDDGKREGEFSAVFYRLDRFEKKDGGTFWLSETPEVCSFGWDAVCRRVCSWVELADREGGQSLHVFNTHFDHVGVEARKNAADPHSETNLRDYQSRFLSRPGACGAVRGFQPSTRF